MTTELFIGMDISSFKVDICVLPCELSISIRDFYESEEFKKVHQELPYDITSVDYIASLNPTVVILEPTGKYGQFWIDNLRSRKIPILMVNQSMVKETRKSFGGSDSKDDPYDCLVLLQCYFTHYVRQYSRLFWVTEKNETVIA
jgi:transposase